MYYKLSVKKILKAQKETLPDTKGALFEEAACEIFTTIPYFEKYDSNIVVADGSQEIDIRFIQRGPSELASMGLSIYMECKCTKTKVPSKEVYYFGEKLVTAGVHVGIIFSTSGLSGAESRRAHAAILNFRIRAVHILSITLPEIKTLDGPSSLTKLIIHKYMSLLAGKVE